MLRLRNGGHLIKEKKLLPSEQFFAFRADPVFRHRYSCKQTGSPENCLPLKTLRKKMEEYPYTIKYLQTTDERRVGACLISSFHIRASDSGERNILLHYENKVIALLFSGDGILGLLIPGK